ncbi:MAG: alkaline phosphatase family protein [Anaerolineae bacterium]|nr:alkaline phosphatase family protein [Anaerolineae bacterium]
MSFRKLLVIGLDGAPYPLIRDWAQAGYLPNLARLIEQGSFGILRSTMPVHSPTAWASFMTGLNPGNHGVFDFVKREKDSYQFRFVRANQIGGVSLWRWLSMHGRQVGIMNVPMTYPPEPVNGYLISGLGTPNYVTYTYPPELTDELKAQGYRVNKDAFFKPGKEDEWLADIYDTSARRTQTAVRLLKEKPWDFFMMVFRNTDEICHFFWHHMDETHPSHNPQAPERYKNAIRDFYQQVDTWVGELVQTAGEDINILVMSDHGAGALYKDVFLNEWLWQKGWLHLKEEMAGNHLGQTTFRHLGITRQNISNALTRLHLHRVEVEIKKRLGDRIQLLPRDERLELTTAVDWTRTKAYSFGYYGQIYINLRGREPQGIVEPGEEYEKLCQEIANHLRDIVDPADGRPLIDHIYFRKDLYHGSHLQEAPDLLCVMRNFTYITRKGYEFAARRGALLSQPYTHETGSHRLEGILIASGPDIGRTNMLPVSIQDLAPTCLHLLGCPVPSSMDGKVVTDILSASHQTYYPIQYADYPHLEHVEDDQSVWNDEMETEITEQLRKLGYMG